MMPEKIENLVSNIHVEDYESAYLERDSMGRPMPVDWDWEAWERIKVPACWNMEREELRYFEGSGVYTRVFRYLPERKDERAFLRFEGAAYRASVFLNGVFLWTHDGASTPFCAEITDAVRSDNRLIVVVESRRRPDRVPADNTDWFNYGGLYRDVLLLRTPALFIKDWFIRLVPDGSFGTIEFDVEVAAPKGDIEAVTGEVRLRIAELSVDLPVTVTSGKGHARFASRPELWSPESPKLYEIELSCEPAGGEAALCDVVRDRIGFHELRVEGRDILLNGRSIYLKGVCVHEDHYLTGKTTDEEGVLLWEEVPVYWAIAFENPTTYLDAENQLTELVLRDRNRASGRNAADLGGLPRQQQEARDSG